MFSDDFESATVGEEPAGWDNFVGWVANGINRNGNTFALVDDSRAYTGNQSMMFSGGSSPTMITRALPEGTTDVYLKAQVYMTRQVGENPGANHEHFMGMRGSVGSANNEVRFGEIKGVIGTNEVPSDNISPTFNA